MTTEVNPYRPERERERERAQEYTVEQHVIDILKRNLKFKKKKEEKRFSPPEAHAELVSRLQLAPPLLDFHTSLQNPVFIVPPNTSTELSTSATAL